MPRKISGQRSELYVTISENESWFLKCRENSKCVANNVGLLAEQTSEQGLRQRKLERLTDGSCFFSGETASSGDTQKTETHLSNIRKNTKEPT